MVCATRSALSFHVCAFVRGLLREISFAFQLGKWVHESGDKKAKYLDLTTVPVESMTRPFTGFLFNHLGEKLPVLIHNPQTVG